MRTQNLPPPHPPHPPPPPPLKSPFPPSPVEAIAKEEEGECMEKIFHETQGKHSSSGRWRREMARRSVELTLSEDKQEMGWDAMSLGWAGWGVDRAHGLCAPFPFLYFPSRKK